MSLNENALKGIWIEKNMIQETKIRNEKRLEFKRQSTQNIVRKTVETNRHLGLIYCDIMGTALEHAVNTVLTFKIKDYRKNWSDIVSGDLEQNNKLWKAIDLSLQWKLSNVDPLVKRTYENATKSHVIIKPIFSSLDQVVNELDGETIKLSNLMTDHNMLWGSKEGYQSNDLIEWFWNHVEEVLTPKQLQFVQKFREGEEGDRRGYIPRIRERMLKEQKRQGYEMSQSNLEKQINKKINALKSLIKIIESDEALENQNRQVNLWIKEHICLDWIDEMAFLTLGKRNYQKMMIALRAENLIPNSIIYKISEAALSRLEYLESFDTSCTPSSNPVEVNSDQMINVKQKQNSQARYKTKMRVLLPTGVEINVENYPEN